jgi:hypothetical protein
MSARQFYQELRRSRSDVTIKLVGTAIPAYFV